MEHELELHEFTISSLHGFGLTINDRQAKQFMRYLDHLIEWNKTTNLTSITNPKEIIIKHFVDSLLGLVATNFPENAVLVDVGSGGGFPGIPLKIIREDLHVVLVEPTRKKCSFLNSVIGLLRLRDISVFDGTFEQYARRPIHRVVDVVVVRALKFQDLREPIYPLLATGGKIILYRTESIVDQDVEEGMRLVSESDFILPEETGKRVISVLEINKLQYNQ